MSTADLILSALESVTVFETQTRHTAQFIFDERRTLFD